jgi:TolB-like protein/predicted Zn-dependent protease
LSFISELKRRNVLRVAAAYLVSAWLLIQVAETIFPLFGMGDGPARMAVIVLVIAFIPALIFAWVFEFTPDGLKKDGDVDRSEPAIRNAGKKLDKLIMAVLVLALLYFAIDKFVITPEREVTIVEQAMQAGAEQAIERARLGQLAEKSVAVLPFVTRSSREDTVFFADGMHDDLLTRLANIGSLRVISRTSVMKYRDVERNMREIGDELGATSILEGGIQQAGGNVRINMQLIDAQTDEHLWAQTYDRALTLENVFAIQSEIAESIAGQLEATLSPAEQIRVREAPTLNFEAHEVFIQGKQLFALATFEALAESVEKFETALTIDPDFVQARVALAYAWAKRASVGSNTVNEMLANGLAHIERAVAEDPGYAFGQAVLGNYMHVQNLPEAEETILRAIELNPNNVDTLELYATVLRSESRFEDALPIINRALKLDPLSVNLFHELGRALTFRGRFEEAETAFNRISQINPGNPYAAHGAALASILSGQIAKAAYWSDQAAAIDPDDFENPATSVYLYISIGQIETAKHRVDESLVLGENEPYPLSAQALYLHSTGDKARALSIARSALTGQLEDRWGSERVFLHLLAIEAINTKTYDEALAWFRQRIPECLEAEPVVNESNITKAVDLAHLLMLSGSASQAQNLLKVIVRRYDEMYARGSANYPLGISKVEALALLGQKQAAITALQEVFDDGWRMLWRWNTEDNPNLATVESDLQYRSIVDAIKADIAAQVQAYPTKF